MTEEFAQRKETMALVLAIGGVLLPVIASAFALLVAYQARGIYREHPEYSGSGLVVPAIVLGWAGLAFGIAAVVYAFG
ncbi:hypothetical protein OJ998_13310 [Solirubrobacter taibaiensis]|nr:hypothetical protein [Solirubrobacter taibaiensis]